ncbi:DNA polymerase III subunit gamma/tau [Kangiella sp. HD9-110m-PIT-SAG07]|nr:DNA polymerase III subunit gamma/tau [Kangiella sp. HD9-110m-PIT-SAG07]
MSYQVLARKWRPKNFQELRGQEHVSRALVNAIESGRLHHAYLFTGTRGVGKTTIARILSKCLNCEAEGVTATPCGQCGSCSEIDEGRFVDLIEVDAASRTKVDDTRELLENVQYRPTRGRYKVYLIDEVHMLSNSSFNALLKTLEEPPEHVIFLLATTDPQKLPVTVLSRCLQFHLKHMDEDTIANHLNFILEQESINFEEAALRLIAQSAEGSMRDGLSLLDQAIAYGQGKVLEEDIRTMLGTIDHKFMVRLLDALASKDTVMAIKAVDDMSHYPVDFADALKELLSRIHQVAVYQATQVLLDTAASYVTEFADVFEAADLQMYYQLGLHARRDLEWAPTAKQGLEMALLRMLAFQIDTGADSSSTQSSNQPSQLTAKKKVSVTSSKAIVNDEAKNKSDVSATPEKSSLTQGSSTKSASEKASLADSPSQLTSDVSLSEQSSQQEKSEATTSAQKTVEPKADNDNFAGYEQYMQQEESDKEDVEPADFSPAPSNPTANPLDKHSIELQRGEEPQSEESQSEEPNEHPQNSNSESDDEALASLHSALGMNLTGEAPAKPEPSNAQQQELAQSTEGPKATEEKLTQSEVDMPSVEIEPSGIVPPETELTASSPDKEPLTEDNSEEDTVVEVKYDSDIERLMQAKHEYEQESQVASDVGRERSGGADADDEEQPETMEEPEYIPELNVSEEAMEWANLVKKLELDGTYHQIAQSSCAVWSSEQGLTLELSPEQEILLTAGAKANVQSSLSSFLDKEITIDWQLKQPSMETPAEIWQHQAKLRLQKACEDLNQHPFSQQLQQQFGAKIDRQSVVYLND